MNIIGGAGPSKVNLMCSLRSESIEPEAKLSKWTQRVRPDSHTISPLGPRDKFSDGRQVYQLVLVYKIIQSEDGKVIPRLPLLNDRLYESPFEAQLCMIFDENKKYMGCSDAYPRAISLKKGSYVIRAQVCPPVIISKLQYIIVLTWELLGSP